MGKKLKTYYFQDHNNGHRGEVELTPEEFEAVQLALGAMGRVGRGGGVWFHLEDPEPNTDSQSIEELVG